MTPDLTILETRVYRGPNVWSYEQAIHLVVDLGALEEYPTNRIEGFTDRLLECLPGLERHTCSRGVRGGFVERLREGTWLGHVAEHVALQLQQEAGHDLRRLDRLVAQVDDAQHDGLVGEVLEDAEIELGLRRLDRNLLR